MFPAGPGSAPGFQSSRMWPGTALVGVRSCKMPKLVSVNLEKQWFYFKAFLKGNLIFSTSCICSLILWVTAHNLWLFVRIDWAVNTGLCLQTDVLHFLTQVLHITLFSGREPWPQSRRRWFHLLLYFILQKKSGFSISLLYIILAMICYLAWQKRHYAFYAQK